MVLSCINAALVQYYMPSMSSNIKKLLYSSANTGHWNAIYSQNVKGEMLLSFDNDRSDFFSTVQHNPPAQNPVGSYNNLEASLVRAWTHYVIGVCLDIILRICLQSELGLFI